LTTAAPQSAAVFLRVPCWRTFSARFFGAVSWHGFLARFSLAQICSFFVLDKMWEL
jgi:hypothetical protein